MISSFTKRAAIMATAVIAVAAPAAAFALGYGPANRPTYTWTGNTTKGADHVVFNSFTNTPNVGDERGFFGAKDASDTNGAWQDTMQVKPGQEILLRTYVHNNADASLNASGAGIAHNTKVRIALPTATSTSLGAISYVSADNADNGVTDADGARNVVSDSVNLQDGNAPFSVSYVAGSAELYNEAKPSGQTLDDSIVTTGAPIGYDKLDGNLPGCFQYVGLVTIKVKINGPSVDFTKQTTTPGSTDWKATQTAKVGDTLSWKLTYKNTSSAVVKNATIKDQLPAHLQIVPGSVSLVDGLHPNGVAISDTDLFNGGQSVGDLSANNGGGWIRYRTVVKNDLASDECSPLVKNIAVISATGLEAKYAEATATIDHGCVAPATTVSAQPTSLPDTGAEGLAGLTGLGALGYATRAYVRSRKDVINALRK